MKKAKLESVLDQIAELVSRASNGESGEESIVDGGPGSTRRRFGRIDARDDSSLLALRDGHGLVPASRSEVHMIGARTPCATDHRGHATPGGRSPFEIVVEASEGFVPLWEEGVTLRWRFDERSLERFEDPERIRSHVRELLAEALSAWGDAAPVRFRETGDAWDFAIVVRDGDRCSPLGCTLASAFFPDAGRHELVLYPKMFAQSRKEQVDTLIHETGHVFGLRHFFADVRERAWPSEVFGTHRPFSIMNYGRQSELTEDDRNDLRRLYDLAWSGALTNVNETPIRFVEPYHTSGRVASRGCN